MRNECVSPFCIITQPFALGHMHWDTQRADQQRIMACLQQVIAAVCPWALVYLKHLQPTQLHLGSQAGPGVHAIQPFCIQSLLSKTTGVHEQHAQNTKMSFIFTQEQGLKLVATSQLQSNLASCSRKGAKAKSFQGGKQSSSKADCAECCPATRLL